MKRALALITLLAVAVGGLIVYVGRPRGETTVQRATRGAPEIFDASGTIAGGAARASFNSAGTRLVLLTSEGVAVAEEGEIDLITPPQAPMAAAAWLPGTTDIAVIQAPVADRIAVINADGNETGFVPVSEPLEVGPGHGLAVDPERRRAVVGVERREALQPLQRYLALVDLRSGAVSPLTDAAGPHESEPHWLDRDQILYTRGDNDGTEAVVLDVVTGTERVAAVNAVGLGGVGATPVYASAGAVSAGISERQVLYRLEEGESVAAVDPTGGRLVILESLPTGTRLRAEEVPQLDFPA